MLCKGQSKESTVFPIILQQFLVIFSTTTLTGTFFETGAYGVPSKSQKSFICGGVRQTITLKSPGKGAPPSTPSWGLQ